MVSDTAKKWSCGMQHLRDLEQDKKNQRKKAMENNKNNSMHDNNDYRYNNDDINDGQIKNNCGSTLIDIGSDHFTSSDIKTLFELDWCNMKFNWLHNLDMTSRMSIHDFLQQNYNVICQLFFHYCGVGKGI